MSESGRGRRGCDRIWKQSSRSFGIALNALGLGAEYGQIRVSIRETVYEFENVEIDLGISRCCRQFLENCTLKSQSMGLGFIWIIILFGPVIFFLPFYWALQHLFIFMSSHKFKDFLFFFLNISFGV